MNTKSTFFKKLLDNKILTKFSPNSFFYDIRFGICKSITDEAIRSLDGMGLKMIIIDTLRHMQMDIDKEIDKINEICD